MIPPPELYTIAEAFYGHPMLLLPMNLTIKSFTFMAKTLWTLKSIFMPATECKCTTAPTLTKVGMVPQMETNAHKPPMSTLFTTPPPKLQSRHKCRKGQFYCYIKHSLSTQTLN